MIIYADGQQGLLTVEVIQQDSTPNAKTQNIKIFSLPFIYQKCDNNRSVFYYLRKEG